MDEFCTAELWNIDQIIESLKLVIDSRKETCEGTYELWMLVILARHIKRIDDKVGSYSGGLANFPGDEAKHDEVKYYDLDGNEIDIG